MIAGARLASSDFRAPWWLRSAHLQTSFATLFRRGPRVSLERERIELEDGDFVDLDWTRGGRAPVVLILHGLEGSSASPYARGMLAAAEARGWRAAVMHFRGCSGEPNRLPRTYHSGETGDLQAVVDALRARGQLPAAIIGYSLGGNVLLKWLGEIGADSPLAAAATVSVPYTLASAAERLACGLSRIYQRRLIRELRAKVERKFAGGTCPVDLGAARASRTFFEFDDCVTAPLHGFDGVDDYYTRSSSRQYLHRIRTPTLMIHAEDDPFMTPRALPAPEELSPSVRFEVSARGGHVGFVYGALPWRPRYWLEERIPAFLESHFD